MMTTAAFTFFMVMMIVMLLLQLCQLCCQRSLSCHSLLNLRTGQFIPRCCNNSSLIIQLPYHGDSCVQLLLRNRVRSGQHNSGGSFDLIIIEFTKVFHINLDLACINHSNRIPQGNLVIGDFFNCTNHIRKLADSGWFDNNPVRCVLSQNLLQSLSKITNQTAANTAGVHLCNINASFL